jgi:hypothetical protein
LETFGGSGGPQLKSFARARGLAVNGSKWAMVLPEGVYEALRKMFDERVKIHDLVIERTGAVLLRRDYPSLEALRSKAAKKR